MLSAGGDCGLLTALPHLLHAITGINAAAAAAAAELAAAIHRAPASQLALQQWAAMAAGAAATGTEDAGGGVVRVKVLGVAGSVELVSEAAGAAAGDNGSEGAAAAEGLGEEGGEGGTGGEEEGRLPDLGAGEDGQPLSRKLRQQEGLTSWATVGQPASTPGFVTIQI